MSDPRAGVRVAVVLGGPSAEHEISLQTGRNVLAGLDPDRFLALEVFVGKDARFRLGRSFGRPGEGHSREPLGDPIPAHEALRRLSEAGADVAFLALHGPFGEDGTIQGFLDVAGIPYTGSGVAASSLAMNKSNARHVLRGNGVPVAKGIELRRPEGAESAVREAIGVPCVVKPNDLGSSVGVSIVRSSDGLAAALEGAFAASPRVLVEEYVDGIELTCGVLGNAGRSGVRALPPTEIRAPQGRFFDYQVKYEKGAATEITPAPIPDDLTRRVTELALLAHDCLGCRGLSRTDFRVRGGGDPVVLEVNTLPGLTATSLLPQAAAAAGISFPELLTLLVDLALEDAPARAARA